MERAIVIPASRRPGRSERNAATSAKYRRLGMRGGTTRQGFGSELTLPVLHDEAWPSPRTAESPRPGPAESVADRPQSPFHAMLERVLESMIARSVRLQEENFELRRRLARERDLRMALERQLAASAEADGDMVVFGRPDAERRIQLRIVSCEEGTPLIVDEDFVD